MIFLKAALWVAAFGCLVATPFIFLPWHYISSITSFFGVEPIPSNPIIIYFFRVTCAVFGMIGVYFIILAKNPFRNKPMLLLGAYGLLTFGIVSLIFGIICKIRLITYIGDAFFGILLCIMIIILMRKSQHN